MIVGTWLVEENCGRTHRERGLTARACSRTRARDATRSRMKGEAPRTDFVPNSGPLERRISTELPPKEPTDAV